MASFSQIHNRCLSFRIVLQNYCQKLSTPQSHRIPLCLNGKLTQQPNQRCISMSHPNLKDEITLSTKKNLLKKKSSQDQKNDEKAIAQTEVKVKEKVEDFDTLIDGVSKEFFPSTQQSVERKTMKSTVMNQILKMEDNQQGNDINETKFMESIFDDLPKQSQEKQTYERPFSERMRNQKSPPRNLFSRYADSNIEMESGNFCFDLENAGRLNVLPIINKDEIPQPKSPPEDQLQWTAQDWYNKYENDTLANVKRTETITNSFQEQILLTKQGKMFTFPINNEEGMEEEQEVPFYSHVFLDEKLEDWCPKSGPLRLFMNAVVLSLSLNGHLSLQEKHDHIDWFRSYFDEKLQVLEQIGLVQSSIAPGEAD